MLELSLALALGLLIGILATWLALREQWWTPYMRQKEVWQQAFAKKKEELGDLRRRLRLLAGEYEIAERKVELAEVETSTMRREIARRKMEMDTLNDQLKEVDGYVKSVEGQLGEVQKQRDILREELHESQQRPLRELADTRIAMAELGVEYEALQTKMVELEQERNGIHADLTTLRQEIAYRQGGHDASQHQLDRLVQERDAANRGLVRMVTVGAELAQLSQQLTQAAQATPSARAVALPKEAVVYSHSGLRIVHGIGPTYAQRLDEAGVKTLADLVARSPEDLAEIVQLQSWQKGAAADWILQAQDILAKQEQE